MNKVGPYSNKTVNIVLIGYFYLALLFLIMIRLDYKLIYINTVLIYVFYKKKYQFISNNSINAKILIFSYSFLSIAYFAMFMFVVITGFDIKF